MEEFDVILLAGGTGKRMQSSVPKQYIPLQSQLVAQHSFKVFAELAFVNRLVVVCDPLYQPVFSSCPRLAKELLFAMPGERRQDSLENGLQLLKGGGLVCVHDAARPFIDQKQVIALVKEASLHGAAVLGVKVKSTIKVCDTNKNVIHTPERDTIWEIQTPQAAYLDDLMKGLQIAREKQLTVTDEGGLLELQNKLVRVVEGSYTNIKLTTPEDFHFAKQLSCIAIS
ncbi:MAG: 2-C-methyl-D-erythritol 4-phosphate cytidylyltransferase [Parachlamydia sp.]|jgi:2-C-methyl-D-erythritol 4-phosphate cytidylyltransferase|nr:2-C-methyl-D-erythritol 4-phosphate cytidylyltransferase [Parachlamydia sp.]